MKHGLNKAEENQETKSRGFVPTKDLWIFGGQIPPCEVLPTGAMVEWSLIAKAIQRIHNERVQGVEITRDAKPSRDGSNPKDAVDHRVQGSGEKQNLAAATIPIPQEIITLLEQATPTPWKINGYRPYSLISRDPNESTYEKGDDKFFQFVHFSGTVEEQKRNAKLVENAINFVAKLVATEPPAKPETLSPQTNVLP